MTRNVEFDRQGNADPSGSQVRASCNMSHKVLIALVALVVLGLLLAVGVWAYDDAQKDQIAPGIEVGGVDVGGRDADSARKIIKREVVAPLQQPVVVSYEGKDYTLTPKQLHETADVDGMVQEAIDRSRQGNILDRVTALRQRRRRERGPRAARVTIDKGRSRTSSTSSPTASTRTRSTPRWSPRTAERSCRRVRAKRVSPSRRGRLTKAIYAAAQSPGSHQTVRPVVKQTKPEVTTKDLPRVYPRYIVIDRASFTLRFFHHLKLEKSVHGRGGPAGPRDSGRPLPRPGQAGRTLLARAQLRLGREPRRPGDPAGPRRSAQGALDRDLRRRRHPRHRRGLARSATPPPTAACGWRSRT